MKKGINQWSFPSGMPAEDCMKLAKEAGFDGIELSFAATGEIAPSSKESELLELKGKAGRIGIEIAGLASGLGWEFGLTSADKSVRERAVEAVKAQLEAAAVLGVDTILVVPGAVGVDFIPNAEVVPYVQAYENALAGLSELSGHAESCGVAIGVENVWNKFLLSPLEMRRFLDEIGSPWVGAYFDVGNTVLNGYPEHWIQALDKRIKKVHFKDYRRNTAGLTGFVDLLAGDVDYPAVVEALRKVGYDNYVIAEMIPAYRHHTEQIIFNTSASMDRILGRNGKGDSQ